jgi:hypothetical protein
MKILIPYDGSINANIALDSLQTAEFAGNKHEILVIVTDVWLHETREEFFSTRAGRKRQMEMSGISSYAPALRAREEAQFFLREVSCRLESKFPLRNIRVEMLPGFSLISSEVLERAKSWGADIIIFGSHEESHSAAKRVIAEAQCSVRIVRAFNSLNGKSAFIKNIIAGHNQLSRCSSTDRSE